MVIPWKMCPKIVSQKVLKKWGVRGHKFETHCGKICGHCASINVLWGASTIFSSPIVPTTKTTITNSPSKTQQTPKTSDLIQDPNQLQRSKKWPHFPSVCQDPTMLFLLNTNVSKPRKYRKTSNLMNISIPHSLLNITNQWTNFLHKNHLPLYFMHIVPTLSLQPLSSQFHFLTFTLSLSLSHYISCTSFPRPALGPFPLLSCV